MLASFGACVAADDAVWRKARANGALVDEIFARTRKMVHAWLTTADPKTLLLPDRIPGVLFGK